MYSADISDAPIALENCPWGNNIPSINKKNTSLLVTIKLKSLNVSLVRYSYAFISWHKWKRGMIMFEIWSLKLLMIWLMPFSPCPSINYQVSRWLDGCQSVENPHKRMLVELLSYYYFYYSLSSPLFYFLSSSPQIGTLSANGG